jgi:hypothetical protein
VGKQIESIAVDRLRAFTSGGQYEKQYLRGYVQSNEKKLEQVFESWLTKSCYAGSYIMINVTMTST